MNITHHNYEEFFILYMDNELDSEERRMVEAFVQQHPDLKEELDSLLQYKLVPDTGIVFEGKEDLLKENGHSLITLNNYEEWLSLYIDNELNSEQTAHVDQFLAAHPAAQKEVALLQQTKLHPENIVFSNKESLYRKEEKTRRIPVWGWRAAAAVLILALGISSVILLNRNAAGGSKKSDVAKTNSPGNTTESNTPNQQVKENNTAVVPEKNTQVTSPFVAEAKNQGTDPVQKTKDNSVAVAPAKKVIIENKQPHISITPVKKDEQAVAQNFPEQKPTNNLPKPLNNPNSADNNTGNAVAVNTLPDNKVDAANPDNSVTKGTSSPSDSYKNAVYNPDADSQLEQPDGKKNKNRGFFRKIARTFQKRTNIDPTDDNRLLVGGLAIKLK